ncbi:hypothetical protein Tco_0007698 [Tanacetum coccineum]
MKDSTMLVQNPATRSGQDPGTVYLRRQERPSSIITAKELRRRAVKRFLDDDDVMCGKEVDDVIKHLYAWM